MKPRTCNQSVALLIRKFTLPAVQAAVEMAAELAKPAPSPKKKAMPKHKTMSAASTQLNQGDFPERFDR